MSNMLQSRYMVEIKSLPPYSTLQDTLDEGLRNYLHFYFDSLRQHAENSLHSSDPNDIHKLRTSARRMRSALHICRKELHKAPLALQNQRLKEIGSISTPLRDLDVLIPKIQHFLADQIPEYPPSQVLTLLEERQKTARKKYIAFLGSNKYDHFINDFIGYLDQPLIRSERKLDEYGKRLLSKHLNNALNFFQEIDKTCLEELHKLRIQLKILRYGTEFFSVVLKDNAKKILNQTKNLQDLLGELNDIAVAEEIFRSALQDELKSQDPAINAYIDCLHTRKQVLLAEFPPLWEEFIRQTSDQLLGNDLLTS